MALLNQFIDFDPIVDRLWELFEPKIDDLLAKVIALLPVVGAAAAKAIIDRFPELIRAIIERDPDIPFVSDIFDLSEFLSNSINASDLPIEIPGLDRLGDLFGRR